MENFVQENLFDDTVANMPLPHSKSSRSPRRSRSSDTDYSSIRSSHHKRRTTARRPRNVPEVRIPPSPATGGAEVRLVRNPRRKRSISAYREQGAIVIQIPARLPEREIRELIPEMVQRVLTREARERISDQDLMSRALELLAIYLPEFSEKPASVTWRSMDERWGSCTTVDRTIRISERLNGAPQYVLDYILVHELVHLRIADHGPEFADLLDRYGDGDRASAFLEGYESGSRA